MGIASLPSPQLVFCTTAQLRVVVLLDPPLKRRAIFVRPLRGLFGLSVVLTNRRNSSGPDTGKEERENLLGDQFAGPEAQPRLGCCTS